MLRPLSSWHLRPLSSWGVVLIVGLSSHKYTKLAGSEPLPPALPGVPLLCVSRSRHLIANLSRLLGAPKRALRASRSDQTRWDRDSTSPTWMNSYRRTSEPHGSTELVSISPCPCLHQFSLSGSLPARCSPFVKFKHLPSRLRSAQRRLTTWHRFFPPTTELVHTYSYFVGPFA